MDKKTNKSINKSIDKTMNKKIPEKTKCKCGKDAVIFRPYEGQALCKDHFLHAIESKVKKTIRQFELIKRNDKIAVGLSGGSDSSVLLYLLNKFFKNRPDLEIFAIFINEGIPKYRNKLLIHAKGFCERINVKLYDFTFKEDYGIGLDEMIKKNKEVALSPCTYCGVLRRDILNRHARELGATKLAIGHNLDDEVEAIMMNYIRGDLQRLVRMGPKTAIKVSNDFVSRIKPLLHLPKNEITLYAQLRNIKVMPKECPFGGNSHRFEVREFINKMEDEHPTTKYSILNTFLKIHPAILEAIKGESKNLKKCERCGEPTNHTICKKCQLLEDVL